MAESGKETITIGIRDLKISQLIKDDSTGIEYGAPIDVPGVKEIQMQLIQDEKELTGMASINIATRTNKLFLSLVRFIFLILEKSINSFSEFVSLTVCILGSFVSGLPAPGLGPPRVIFNRPFLKFYKRRQ